MKFLLQGQSNNEHYDADIQFVWVDVTPEMARTILRRAKAFKKFAEEDKAGPDGAGSLLEMYFWDNRALYFTHSDVPEKEAQEIWDNGEGDVTEWDPGDKEGERTECDQMIITEDSVHFTAIPKHTSIYIVSDRIRLSKIEECLTEEKTEEKKTKAKKSGR